MDTSTIIILIFGIMVTVLLALILYKQLPNKIRKTPRKSRSRVITLVTKLGEKWKIKPRWSWFWWTVVLIALIGFIVLGYHYHPLTRTGTRTGVGSTNLGNAQEFRFTLTTEQPIVRITIPPWYRYKVVEPIPDSDSWFSQGELDRGNRIQTFELIPPTQEVQLRIIVIKCKNRTDCAW
jgi:hypothetical protein